MPQRLAPVHVEGNRYWHTRGCVDPLRALSNNGPPGHDGEVSIAHAVTRLLGPAIADRAAMCC